MAKLMHVSIQAATATKKKTAERYSSVAMLSRWEIF
jgi:hypothetical protein